MLRTTAALVLASALAGCASSEFIRVTTCTEGYRQVLVEEDARLVQQKLDIEEMEANGSVLPGYSYAFTGIPAERLMWTLKKAHNREYDRLVDRAAFFNATCTHPVVSAARR